MEWISLAVGIIGIIIGVVQSANQESSAKTRSSRETKVRNVYKAAINRYGITYDQLSQYLSKLGIRLNELENSTRGSARLSKARQIYRDFMSKYPDRVKQVESVQNNIKNEMNRLEAEGEEKAAKIEKGKDVRNTEITQDIHDSTNYINTELDTLEPETRTSQIDTSVQDKEELADFQQDSPTQQFQDSYNQYREAQRQALINKIKGNK